MRDDDPDATIKAPYRLAPAPEAKTRRRLMVVAAAAVVIAGVGFGSLTLVHQAPAPLRAPAPHDEPVAPHLPYLTEAEILAERGDTVIVVRFRANRDILVLDFPSLTAQGLALNRMASFLEKRGLPRDRVLNDRELADAITADRSTVETYYYGHDYRAADIQRFFATADRQGLALTPAEQELRTLLAAEDILSPNARSAVISIPREGSDPFVDAPGRASLLRHELSHGEFFTNVAYADFVLGFWRNQMSDSDRASFRAFLTRQGYDEDNEELMANETQAHLMHTTDPRYFNAAACGLPASRLQALRTDFIAGMPPGWLRTAAQEARPRLP